MGLSFLTAQNSTVLTNKRNNDFEVGTEKMMQRGLVSLFLGRCSLVFLRLKARAQRDLKL